MNGSIRTQLQQASRVGPQMIALVCALGALAEARWAVAGNPNPGIAPIHSKPHGKSYSQWAAAWWQWSLTSPAPVNPVLDQTGENAGVNQSGPVWFLAGNSGGVSERDITVPAGKALFVPILNQLYLGFPCDERNLPGCEADQALEAASDLPGLLSFIEPTMDGATVTCEIDGVSVQGPETYRVRSTAIYGVTLPEDHLYAGWGLPSGPYHPCVDVGYYLMIAPLPPGDHTLHFTGQSAGGAFTLDVTYHIHVK